jgi:hypothetical protein
MAVPAMRHGRDARATPAADRVAPVSGKPAPESGSIPYVVLSNGVRPWSAPDESSPRVGAELRHPAVVRALTVQHGNSDDTTRTDWIEFEHGVSRAWLPLPLVALETPPPKRGENLPIGREIVDIRVPLPLSYKPDDLAPLPARWAYSPDREILLRRETLRRVVRMFDAARADGVHLRVVSGWRSAKTQRSIYLAKIEKDGMAQNIVAKPGHSEHQLGTTIDICGLDPKSVLEMSFSDTPEGRWVARRAPEFGFHLSYTVENQKETGFIPEPWHLRYKGLP